MNAHTDLPSNDLPQPGTAPDRRAILGGSLGLAAAVAATALPAIAEVASHPDAALLALGEEMDRAEAVVRMCDASPAPSDDEAAGRASEEAYAAAGAIWERIAATSATTLEGLAVKARAVAFIYRDDFSAEGMEMTGTTDYRLIWSILADLAPDLVVAPSVEAAA